MVREGNLQRYTGEDVKKYNSEYLFYSTFLYPLKNAIKENIKGRVLDIGCGNKPYANWIVPISTQHFGCDIVQSSGNCVDLVCEATRIPLPDSSFDSAISTQTIEHIGDYQLMVNEAYRLLKPGGHFVVSGPLYWPLHEEPFDFFRFTKHGFKHVLEKAGFEEIEIIPNGGKWALLGQVLLQTLPVWITFPKVLKLIHNMFFKWLDDNFFDATNTMNYVVIGRKIK